MRVARYGDAAAALLPEQELQQALHVAPGDLGGLAGIGQNGGAKEGDGSVASFQGQGQGDAATALRHQSAVGTIPQGSRLEVGIEHRAEFGIQKHG